METLIAKNGTKNRWYPQAVENYKNAIRIPTDSALNRRLNSNFSYSMQYIEYLEKQIDELKLSEVLLTMLYKSYIVTGMGIIEMLFVFLLRQSNNWNTSEWEAITTIPANPKKIDGIDVKVETTLYKKVHKFEMRMDLDTMIKKIESKNLLTITHDVFPAIKKLKDLRNRVYLQEGVDAYDHDYNKVGFHEIQMMRRILYSVLTSQEICLNGIRFSFINESFQKREKVATT